jgi:hypothetical protein
MVWDVTGLAGSTRYRLHREAGRRHMDAARDHALAGDLDAAIAALEDYLALHTEVREPEADDHDELGDET